MSIVHVRIDDRLIHGQITTAWIAATNGSRIIISSDEVAGDPLQQTIVKVTAPPRLPVEVLTSQATIAAAKSGAWDRERIFIICKYPSDVVPLVRAGLQFKEVNVGNVGGMTQHKTSGRKQIWKSVAITEQDEKDFREMIAAGIEFEVRVVPNDRRVDLATLLPKA